MYDKYNRRINYLRVSVTDRCNLRCQYCMPPEGIKLISHKEILSYDEIREFVNCAVEMGVDKVRITGGEPLVRKDLPALVKMIADIKGITDLSMTTNGILVDRYARQLAESGMQRVNISLDTMDPEKYSINTRGGNIEDVLKGIDAALEYDLTPVKLNCVVNKSSDEYDAKTVARFAESKGLTIRYIRKMDLAHGEFGVVEGGDGGNCASCNRLRLTASGKIKPCLFSDLEYSVRELGARKAIEKAVENKPACGTVNHDGQFYNIGG